MEDNKIIDLYFARDEAAIRETSYKYGGYCTAVAKNILLSREDAEECVNDTWLRAWNSMPPARPNILSLFLAKITRNLAIDRYRERFTEKRGRGEIWVCLDELTECAGSGENFCDSVELKEILNLFLKELEQQRREIFMLRYWYMLPVKTIAARLGISSGAVKMSLRRTREALKRFLLSKGFDI